MTQTAYSRLRREATKLADDILPETHRMREKVDLIDRVEEIAKLYYEHREKEKKL